MVGQTIPSGQVAVAHGGGVYTVPSGYYTYSANLEVPGADLLPGNTADDGASLAGKLAYSASTGVAVVERYNSSTGALTFRTLQP